MNKPKRFTALLLACLFGLPCSSVMALQNVEPSLPVEALPAEEAEQATPSQDKPSDDIADAVQEAEEEAEEAADASNQADDEAEAEAETEDEEADNTVAANLIVRELMVLQADRFSEDANSPIWMKTTLRNPVKHAGRAAELNDNGGLLVQPMPLGVITFAGELPETLKMQIELPHEQSEFHAHWPDASSRSRLLEWPTIQQADESRRTHAFNQSMPWLDALRSSEDRLWLATNEPIAKERFVLYDAEFGFKPGINLALKDKAYRVNKVGKKSPAPPLTMLLRWHNTGWSAPSLTAEAWTEQAAKIAELPTETIHGDPLADALNPLALLLTDAGYNQAEVTLALSMIEHAGVKQSDMSLVYVLPEGVIDTHIKLKLKPKPTKLVRTTIVVVNNVNPDINIKIDKLIAQLGDKRWETRAKAQQELIEMGQAAIKQLQKNTNHKDPEIAFRVQQVLDAYDLAKDRN